VVLVTLFFAADGIALLARLDLRLIIAVHAGFEISNAFAKTFREFGDPARAEEDDNNQNDNQ
jgi:hypothetical protein